MFRDGILSSVRWPALSERPPTLASLAAPKRAQSVGRAALPDRRPDAARKRSPPTTSRGAASSSSTRNFRTRHGEIDLVARDGDTLVFVEVRMRTHAEYGGAAASVTAAKRERLVAASLGYLAKLGREPPCRFDAVLLDALDPSRIVWERDVIET